LSGPGRPIAERLAEFYARLGRLPAARSADEALQQIAQTLGAVEDDLSGIPKKDPPPPPNMPDGRMYPPLADFTMRHPDGSITARTRGHINDLGTDGSLTIRNKRTGAVDFEKGGGRP
jgi:hypothetical protein